MPHFNLPHRVATALLVAAFFLVMNTPIQAGATRIDREGTSNHQVFLQKFTPGTCGIQLQAKLTDDLDFIPRDNRTEEEKAKARKEWERVQRERKQRKAMEAAVVAVGGIFALFIYALIVRRLFGIFRSSATPKGIRRLSIVVTPIAHATLALAFATAFSFGKYYRDRDTLVIIYTIQGIIFLPSFILLPLIRRLYLWVHQGFEDDRAGR